MMRRIIPVASKIATVRSLSRPISTCMKVMAGHGPCPPADYVQPTMDDLPVPAGDWTTHYNNQQRKYNLHLLFGAGFFIITMAVFYSTDLSWCNMLPPEKPGPRP